MTFQQVEKAIQNLANEIVTVTLHDGTTMSALLYGAYQGEPDDIRGYVKPYLHVIRLDKEGSPTEKFNCSDVASIGAYT
jgi:hypothetical protein